MKARSTRGRHVLRAASRCIILALALLAVMTTSKVVAVETAFLDDHLDAGQEEVGSVGLVHCLEWPRSSREWISVVSGPTICFNRFRVVASQTYRGPPGQD